MSSAKQISIIAAVCLLLPVSLLGAGAGQRYRDYIDRYASLAMEQQREHGIPASITLAQGILESAAGTSTLATQGNNHFGIKCHAGWEGDTMLRDDDAPDECFRVYGDAQESYRDHSLFLKKRRYAPLFELETTDYRGWAVTLSRCGYATDPGYANRLITIIETYALYVWDNPDADPDDPTATFIMEGLKRTHPVRRLGPLHYVVAVPGDTYASIAREFGLDPSRLAFCNDSEDPQGDVKEWQEVFLQEKCDTPCVEVLSATIGEDETLHSVAQRFGMRVEAVRRLNPYAGDEPGTLLRLKE